MKFILIKYLSITKKKKFSLKEYKNTKESIGIIYINVLLLKFKFY